MPAAAAGPGRPGLWRHRDFLLLWTGQSVSELGSAVTMLALPLTAVVVLRASTFEVGLLAAATTVPFLLIALPAGLAVDRMAKRRLMIGCDAARMLIIGSVPIAAGFGKLTLVQLYVVAVAAGVLTVFFDVAYQSFTPVLLDRDQLPDGNGKLAATQAFAQVAGPGLGGGLFGLLRAGALTADALSYAVSTVSLLLIRTREPAARPDAPAAGAAKPRLRTELFAGLSFVVRAARPAERGHPLDCLGHPAARQPDRRRARLGARRALDDLDRDGRQLGGSLLGGVLAAAPDARCPRAGRGVRRRLGCRAHARQPAAGPGTARRAGSRQASGSGAVT